MLLQLRMSIDVSNSRWFWKIKSSSSSTLVFYNIKYIFFCYNRMLPNQQVSIQVELSLPLEHRQDGKVYIR